MSDVTTMEVFDESTIKKEIKDEPEDPFQNQSIIEQNEPVIKSTNEDVQRAIEGLKEIPDEELQEFLDDDFMEGLNVVDAWEGEEDRIREEQKPRVKEKEQVQSTRERNRREPKQSHSREKPKRDEKKREETRRDPSKSTKDIERDKMRTKRDNESKLLAEKEKAIKHLLDSDNVVPPGTETEAIQSITEKQNEERAQLRNRRSRERRRSPDRPKLSPVRKRSHDRFRGSPHRRVLSPIRRRSPFRISPDKRRSSPRLNSDRRSPLILSPERRRSPYRRLSWERKLSADRRWSAERHRRRPEIHERRRSRSRDRQRSRSIERFRRRTSRSPVTRRYSPRRRSRTRSRSVERRTRKRSPFINELARQLRNVAMMPPHVSTGYIPPPAMEGISPIMNPPVYQQDPEVRPPLSQSYMHQGGPQPPQPPPPPTPSSVLPPMPSGVPPFMNFEIPAPPPMVFEAGPLHPMPPAHYSSGPVMYNQPSPMGSQPGLRPTLLPTPQPVPQPVPAPGPVDHPVMGYPPQHGLQSVVPHLESSNKSANPTASPPSQSYKDHRTLSSHNGFQPPREERLKTPEPPVISDNKQFEKTSLSSLLEASVSAKDSSSPPVLYPGFKPEILRHCEHALRELPIEDPRLNMKGRFFFNPKKEEIKNKCEEYPSNSILLQKGKNKIYWEEDDAQQSSSNLPVAKQTPVQTHQKICQTDEPETDSKYVEAIVDMVDFGVQVDPYDIQEENKDEKRPIMDRLDWNVRETYDYAPKYREEDDLRWSLSNSSQKRPWRREMSPPRRSEEHERHLETVPSPEPPPRNLKLDSPMRSRDGYSGHRGGPIRDHYVRDRYSPNYRRSMDQDDFRENRSDRSRGESPMELEDSEEDLDEAFTFQRGSSGWHGRGKSFRGKMHTMRGKHSTGRPYRGRGSFHKF